MKPQAETNAVLVMGRLASNFDSISILNGLTPSNYFESLNTKYTTSFAKYNYFSLSSIKHNRQMFCLYNL